MALKLMRFLAVWALCSVGIYATISARVGIKPEDTLVMAVGSAAFALLPSIGIASKL
jgi:hypothetical protein